MPVLVLLFCSLIELTSGQPGTVTYQVPEGYETGVLPEDSTWIVLSGENGVFTVVPLLLQDTLDLPYLTAWNTEGDTLELKPPMVTVEPLLPDSLMDPSMPVFPCFTNIPPGFPEDYARNMSFWLVWNKKPPFPWLWVSLAVVIAGTSAFFIYKRRRKGSADQTAPAEEIPAGHIAEKEALALLESESFIYGRWPELYQEIDRQLRVTVAGRFGVVNRALTLNQISRALAATGDGRKFLKEASPLVKEIILQLYADWGSSKDKSTTFIRKLAAIRKEWARK
ncbi:hypothetical protein CSA37_08365 [Candidatus Fermentibacteria bacterium]|nr:MAG: hypothetical protein CSA37_08365 [Candidatus Fermentibacteria bacterium]